MYSQRRVADFGAQFVPRVGDQLGDVLKGSNRVRPHRRLDRFQDEEIGGGTAAATDARQREAEDRDRGGSAREKVVRQSLRRILAERAAK